MSARLLIYTASAGSGKTYRLVTHYLSLAIQQPGAFRHILCLTFTNKATAEMRDRILAATDQLARNASPDLMVSVATSTGLDPAEVQSRALRLRNELLHAYGRFQVTTLDAFFQQVIRAFQQELHLGSGQRLEMDPSEAIDTVISELLEQMDTQPSLERWLMDFTEFRIRNGNTWDVEGELRSMCRLLFNETYRNLLDSIPDVHDYEARCKFTQIFCRDQLRALDREAESIAREATDVLESMGIQMEQLAGRSRTPYKFLLDFGESWRQKPVTDRTEFMKKYHDPGTIAKESELGSAVYVTLVDHFARLSRQAVAFCLDHTHRYNTLSLVTETIFGSAILVELDRLLHAYRVRENILFLPDATRILSGMLRTTDTPFFYERTGNAIHYMLLDEFQDTSWLQWEALRPLIENATASHPMASLIVGDGKQAIYRWRNGDARLLLDIVPAQFKSLALQASMKENWRSGRYIVDFNNQVFIQGVQVPVEAFRQKYETTPGLLVKTYVPEAMQVPMKDYNGFVGWYVPPVEQDPEPSGEETAENVSGEVFVEQELYRQVCRSIQAGFRESDIAILTLRKDHARRYATLLSGLPHPVETDRILRVESQEGLKLETSERVGALIAIAEWVAGYRNPEILARARLRLWSLMEDRPSHVPQEPETAAALQQWWNREVAPVLPLFNGSVASFLTETCRSLEISAESTDLYVAALLDHATAFDQSGMGGLQAFVDLWYDTGQEKWEIPPPERAGGIRIMTYHKSKGLEFPVVILPNPDKPVITYRNDVLLPVGVKEDTGMTIPFATIRLNGKSMESAFRDEVTEERQMSFVDAWNEGYVAFTRAGRALFIISGRHPMQKKAKQLSLMDLIAQSASLFLAEKGWETDTVPGVWFEMGTLDPGIQSEKPEIPALKPMSLKHLARPGSVRLRPPGAPAADTAFGELFHAMLAKCRQVGDIPAVASDFHSAGNHPGAMVSRAVEMLEQMMMHPALSGFFQEGLATKSECGILMPDGSIRRPDRIIFTPQHCVVIECKTGKAESQHRRQLKAYMDQVRAVEGHKMNVRGILVYTENMEVEEMV